MVLLFIPLRHLKVTPVHSTCRHLKGTPVPSTDRHLEGTQLVINNILCYNQMDIFIDTFNVRDTTVIFLTFPLWQTLESTVYNNYFQNNLIVMINYYYSVIGLKNFSICYFHLLLVVGLKLNNSYIILN